MAKINTMRGMERWAKQGGWTGAADFFKDTKSSFKEIQGRRFTVYGGTQLVFKEFDGKEKKGSK